MRGKSVLQFLMSNKLSIAQREMELWKDDIERQTEG